ncbi:MAG TPA: TRAM domain-containing protein [Deinococcales bacterium]|nr:TRAM domain-containing protein [Deinococcales bacterium]
MKSRIALDPALTVIRAALVLGVAAVGYSAGTRLFPDVVNIVYMTVLGALVGGLLSGGPAMWLRRQVGRLASAIINLPPEAALAATVGTILALTISVLLSSILGAIPGFAWYHSLVITAILAALLDFVAVRNQRFFVPFSRPAAPEVRAVPVPLARPKLLDTSVIIDGRVAEVAQTGFLEGPLVVPGFVLRELQLLADQADPIRRGKGRRGLDVLERMHNTPALDLSVQEFEPGAGGVDDQLVVAALATRAAIVTNDSALGKIAGLHGVQVLNLNELAETLRARHGAGDELTITVVKEGSKPGQGVGYLEDGTMVVIEDGLALRGRTVRVAVVSSSQTALGRMIFARPKEVV